MFRKSATEITGSPWQTPDSNAPFPNIEVVIAKFL
jgi:hypothetical protein